MERRLILSYPTWLPELVLLEHYGGSWHKYLDAIYSYFVADFVDDRPYFQGSEIRLKRYPYYNGKEATFWHIIAEGSTEEDRLPNLRRCERIRWPKPIIEHSDISGIKIWKNKRIGETRICIWFQEVEYLIVLAERSNYVLLWTAYLVVKEHQKRKLLKEYIEYCENCTL